MLRIVLAELEKGPRTTEELARRLGASPATIAALVDQLARMGRVELGRGVACSATCAGCAARTGCTLAPGDGLSVPRTADAPRRDGRASGARPGGGSPR